MYSKELIKLLKQCGWQKVSQTGSHLKMKKNSEILIVPVHSKELPIGTAQAIMKKAGLKK